MKPETSGMLGPMHDPARSRACPLCLYSCEPKPWEGPRARGWPSTQSSCSFRLVSDLGKHLRGRRMFHVKLLAVPRYR